MSRGRVIGGPHCPGCASKYVPVKYDFSGIAKMLSEEVAKKKAASRKRKKACAVKKGGG